MDFEWDEEKSSRVGMERGIPFSTAIRIFLDPRRSEDEDERLDYGETRRVTTGMVDGRLVTVVYTLRNGTCRIITAWPASRKERRRYGDR